MIFQCGAVFFCLYIEPCKELICGVNAAIAAMPMPTFMSIGFDGARAGQRVLIDKLFDGVFIFVPRSSLNVAVWVLYSRGAVSSSSKIRTPLFSPGPSTH